ncbi:MAG: trehalose-phosphatase, partial [Bacteroidota bacterium]
LDKKGVLILSETAGASKELSDAILINPNNQNQFVEALKEALTMPEREQMRRMDIMQQSLQRYNIHQWVKLFMERLDFIKKQQEGLQTKPLSDAIRSEIVQGYRRSKRRILFLDYDGTLMGFHANPSDAKPDKDLKKILAALTGDSRNQVVIISGRDRTTLSDWMKDYHLDIIAEHGVWHKGTAGDWEMISNMTDRWKDEIQSVLNSYVDRTPGSFVEQKDYSLVWHYRKVETGLGEIRTRELTSHLKYITSDKDLQVLEGDMVVEIKNSQVNKGKAATKWLQSNKGDFVMACGDDWTDEDTFKSMPSDAHTIKVGGLSSAAKYRVENYKDIRKLLQDLIK